MIYIKGINRFAADGITTKSFNLSWIFPNACHDSTQNEIKVRVNEDFQPIQ